MRVVGIDPAPKKGLSVFDGEDHSIPVEEAVSFISRLRAAGGVLVTWDAPLSGPPTPVLAGAAASGSAYSQRAIESFFSRAATGFKTPAGISVQGYAGCQHWTISRSLVGLPRVGIYDADAGQLPFRLASDDAKRPSRGRHIVEVHPALAIWLWCRCKREADASCFYKTDPDVLTDVWESLLRVRLMRSVLSRVRDVPPTCDDELDARVAYALGRLWLDHPESVVLLGSADAGAFLVPRVAGIVEAFQAFVR